MKVLVIDDNELHLKMCRILIQKLGHEVTTIVALKELKDNIQKMELPDIALIDYRLELGETGVDVLNFIKENSRWKDVTLMALTADVGERSLLENSGFDKVVFKPITETLLKEIIV